MHCTYISLMLLPNMPLNFSHQGRSQTSYHFEHQDTRPPDQSKRNMIRSQHLKINQVLRYESSFSPLISSRLRRMS